MTLPRRLGWVWKDPPPAGWPVGLDGMLVRAANGAGHTGSGFDYARNYAAWAHRWPGRVLPWTWVGPPASSNGAACADALHLAAPGAPLYVADIEGTIDGEQVAAFCARMRRHETACLLGFSSYPTRAQAIDHGVPWDACVATFDISLPQVYFPGQRARLAQVVADHRGLPVHVATAPGDDPDTDRVPAGGDPGWLDSAVVGLANAGVSLWRYGLTGFDQWAAQIGRLADGEELSMPDAQTILDELGTLRGEVRDLRGDPGERAPDLADLLGKIEATYNKAAAAEVIVTAANAVIRQDLLPVLHEHGLTLRAIETTLGQFTDPHLLAEGIAAELRRLGVEVSVDTAPITTAVLDALRAHPLAPVGGPA